MAKKFILKALAGAPGGMPNFGGHRRIERNLLNLSNIGLKWDESLIRFARGIGSSETAESSNSVYPNSGFTENQNVYNTYANIAGNNEYVAFFDKSCAVSRFRERSSMCSTR